MAINSFSSYKGASQTAKIFLWIVAAVCAIAVFSGILQYNLLVRIENGNFNEMEATNNDARQQVIGIVQSIVYIAGLVFFLIWFHASYKNLRSFGCQNLRYTPGWAVGSFFVPIMNFFRPYQIMKETYENSSTTNGSTIDRSMVEPWWAAFLINNLLGVVVLQMSRYTETISSLKTYSVIMTISDAIEVVWAVVTIMLVDQLSKMQIERMQLSSPTNQIESDKPAI